MGCLDEVHLSYWIQIEVNSQSTSIRLTRTKFAYLEVALFSTSPPDLSASLNALSKATAILS